MQVEPDGKRHQHRQRRPRRNHQRRQLAPSRHPQRHHHRQPEKGHGQRRRRRAVDAGAEGAGGERDGRRPILVDEREQRVQPDQDEGNDVNDVDPQAAECVMRRREHQDDRRDEGRQIAREQAPCHEEDQRDVQRRHEEAGMASGEEAWRNRVADRRQVQTERLYPAIAANIHQQRRHAIRHSLRRRNQPRFLGPDRLATKFETIEDEGRQGEQAGCGDRPQVDAQGFEEWCALVDSNHRPLACEASALPLSQARAQTDHHSTKLCSAYAVPNRRSPKSPRPGTMNLCAFNSRSTTGEKIGTEG